MPNWIDPSALASTDASGLHSAGAGRGGRPDRDWQSDSIASLNAALAAEPGPRVTVRLAEMPPTLKRVVRDIQSLFGRRAVFIESDSPGAPAGICRNAGVLFINAKARQPLQHVLAHEFAHSLELSDPLLHASLKSQVMSAALDGAFPGYQAQLARLYQQGGIPRLSPADAANEFVADVLGSALTDPALLHVIRQRLEPSLIRRLANTFGRWLDVVAAKVRDVAPLRDDGFLERNMADVDLAKALVADALVEVARLQRDTEPPLSGIAAAAGREEAFAYLRAGQAADGRQTAESDPLTIIHNISADQLIFSDELGGLAVPSLAITKANSPVTTFGQITLIGRQGLAEPAYDNPVFDADGFTKRFPELIWPAVPAAEAHAFLDALEPDSPRRGTDELYNALVSKPDRSEAVEALQKSPAGLRAFLRSLGVTPVADVVAHAAAPRRAEWAGRPEWQQAIDSLDAAGINVRNLHPDDPEWSHLTDAARRSIDAFSADLLESGAVDRATVRAVFWSRHMAEAFGDDGALLLGIGDAAAQYATRSTEPLFQARETVDALRAQILAAGVEPDLAGWASAAVGPLFAHPSIRVGRQKRPLTLGNAVAAMASRYVRGREQLWAYGAGPARASIARRFRSSTDIDRSRARLGGAELVGESVAVSNKALEAYREAAHPFYEYSDTWAAMDDAMRALTAAATSQSPTDSQFRRALSRHGFRNVSQEVVDLARVGLRHLRSALVEYFEAKPQRAVYLDEFAGAVIPEGAPREVRQVLGRSGVPYREYGAASQLDQAAAIGLFARELQAQGERVMFSRDGQADGPIFYSALTHSIESMSQARAMPEMWLGLISNLSQKGVKREEVEWSGVTEWLGQQSGPVTKADLIAYLHENEVQVGEVELSAETRNGLTDSEHDEFDALSYRYRAEPDDLDHAEYERYCELDSRLNDSANEADEVRYASYTTPGGRNYRELLLTLPVPADAPRNDKAFRQFTIMERDGSILSQGMMPMSERTRLNLAKRPEWIVSIRDAPDPNEQRRVDAASLARGIYTSPHFDRPNVVAHVRFNERLDSEGKRVLFVEEVQSDLHQQGRKHGYAGSPREGFTVYVGGVSAGTYERRDEAEAHQQRALAHNDPDAVEIRPEVHVEPAGSVREADMVPDAPFKQAWPLLTMKRMLRYAADHGFDKLAWLPGPLQAERYDLSKKVDSIVYARTRGDRGALAAMAVGWQSGGGAPIIDRQDVSPEELPAIIGKEAAARLLAIAPDAHGAQVLSGTDLQVGGDGLRAFYDGELRNEVSKYIKKWGGQVGRALISESDEGPLYDVVLPNSKVVKTTSDHDQALATAGCFEGAEVRAAGTAVHSVDITARMREAALAGQPMFRLSGAASRALSFAPSSGFRVDDARARLRNRLGSGVDDLEASGVLTFVESSSDLPLRVGAPLPADATVSGLYDHAARAVYVVTGNVATEDELVSALLHEVGAHYGLKRMLGAGAYRRLISEVQSLASSDPCVSAAADTVACLYPSLAIGSERYWGEVIAHAAEQPGAVSQPWHRRMSLAVRRFLFTTGIIPVRLTEKDITGMVAASLRRSMLDAAGPARQARLDASGVTTPPGRGISWSEFGAELSRLSRGDGVSGQAGPVDPAAAAAGRMWRLIAIDPVTKCPTPIPPVGGSATPIVGQNGVVLDGAAALGDAVSNGVKSVLAWVACEPIPGQVTTPEFKRWFGDSKVVDELGEPLVVHHGTERSGFNRFDRGVDDLSSGTGANGAYFTSHRLGAETYSGSNLEAVIKEGRVDSFDVESDGEPGNYSVYLAMSNPLVVDFGGAAGWDCAPEGSGFAGESLNEIAKYAEARGFDGVIASNIADEGRFGQGYCWGDTTYIVFRSEQIKSATQNDGAFSSTDERIDYRLGAARPRLG